MNDLEHARSLLAMARKDLKALTGMNDAEQFELEVFGFHAQQAVEKSVKAWLAALSVEYPLTHSLDYLFVLLSDYGKDISAFVGLSELTAFAVRYRYEEPDTEIDDLDRPVIAQSVARLVDHVEALLRRG